MKMATTLSAIRSTTVYKSVPSQGLASAPPLQVGTAQAVETQFNNPAGTTIHEDGDYVVTDQHNHRVQKCPKSGTGSCTTIAGGNGAGNGDTQLHYPRGIEE